LQGLELPQINVKLSETDLARLQRRLRTYANNLRKEFDGFADELARIGQTYARSIAPRDKGYLHRAIRWKTDKTSSAMIRIDKATLNSNPSNHQNVNYAAIMHLNNGKMGRGVNIYSGDPEFMFTTRDYLKQVMGREIKIKLGKL